MTLIFDPEWLNWDTDAKEIAKLETKKASGAGFTQGNQNKLDGLLGLRVKRAEGAIFLSAFNQQSVQAAIFRALTRFNLAEEAKQLLNDTIDSSHTVRITQGTHQAEDAHHGHGYMLHFDAKSSRPGGKCFHLYVGQLKSGSLTITSIAYKPNNGGPVTALPEHPEV